MTVNYLFQLIIWFLWLIEPLAATPSLAMPNCNDTCGNVTIPYPFGMGAGCFLHEWYEVLCHDDRPYLSRYYGQEFGGEVLGVSESTITINAKNTEIRVCDDDKAIHLAGDLSGSPFHYDTENVIVFIGCGNVMLFITKKTIQGGFTGQCTSTCNQYGKVKGCFNINCCVLSIPDYSVQNIHLNFSNLVARNNSCGYVLFGSFQGSSTAIYPEDLIGVSGPVVLHWTIPLWIPMDIKNNPNCYESNSYESNSYYSCSCPSCQEGNPYIPNGCQVRYDKHNCVKAPNVPTSHSRKRLIMLVVGGTSFGVVFLGTFVFRLYKIIGKIRGRKLRKKYFKRNGGLLIEQQLSVDENMVDKVRFFTSNELDKATDKFNQNRVLGHGGQGTVYKGMLVDGKIVAIKKSTLANENQLEQFINEVVVVSQINHRNVVKLLGCCLETEVPLLVYEFISNGTLYDLMHNKNDEVLMTWDMRLKIGIEVSGALAYLHSAAPVPIYHRDIKSSNILLDEKYTAKVSDFGISRHVTVEQTHLTTMVKGTFGYLDPEYFQSSQFTEKSDVYSFGVVLVELLTRQKPISSTQSNVEGCLSLATRFLISMEENRLKMILDTQILDTANDKQISAVAILAQRCLSLDGKKRPTMKEVAMELESIKMSHLPSTVHKDFQKKRDNEIELVLFPNGISSSTTANYDTITSSSDVCPLLFNTV